MSKTLLNTGHIALNKRSKISFPIKLAFQWWKQSINQSLNHCSGENVDMVNRWVFGVGSHRSPVSEKVSALRLKQQWGTSEHPLYASHSTWDAWLDPCSCLCFLISKKVIEYHLLPSLHREIKCVIICKVLRAVPGTSSNFCLKVETHEQMLSLLFPGRCEVWRAKKGGGLTQPEASEKPSSGEWC